MLMEVSSQFYSALLMLILFLILVFLILIWARLKHFTGYNDPDQGQIKLHFSDFKKEGPSK